MKKIIVFLFLALFSININAQELDIRWGKYNKVKKTSFVPYFDFAEGETEDKLLIVHHGKKGIVFDVFDKNTLNLVNSVPLKLEKIEWEKKKDKPKFYKAIVNNNNVYLFVYLKIEIDKKRGKKKIVQVSLPLFVASFDLQGNMLSEWKKISDLSFFDIRESSSDFFNTVSDKITFDKKTNLFLVKESTRKGVENNFYDQDFQKLEYEADSKYKNVFFTGEKIWLTSNLVTLATGGDSIASCFYATELNFSNNELQLKNEKCIKTDMGKKLSKIYTSKKTTEKTDFFFDDYANKTVGTVVSIDGMNSLFIMELVDDGNEYTGLNAWKLDLNKGVELYNSEYKFLEKEREVFNKNAFALSHSWESKKDEKKFKMVAQNHTLKNLPFLHCEVENKSALSKTTSSNGFTPMGQSQTTISTSRGNAKNYGQIFTAWFNKKGKLQYTWIQKRQHGGMDGEGDMFLSYLPFYLRDYKYYLFLGDNGNFAKGSNERLKHPLGKGTAFGYYSIDKQGSTVYKEFEKLTKKLKTPPRTHLYYYGENDNVYLMSLSGFKNKICLLKVSPKN